MRLSASIAALALLLPCVASAQTGQLEMTNLGTLEPNVFTGHVLTPPHSSPSKALAQVRILYAPADADDAAFRAQIANAAGGAIVDYFDARNATPSVALLSTYDAVHTFADFGYFDKVAFGNDLATYCDQGGHVILGVFTTGWSGKHWLEGAIMGPNYSPVKSPTGMNHYSGSPYLGDGSTCINSGVSALDINYRDTLVLQGNGVIDGTYLDGEIAHAYRSFQGTTGGSVVFSNGSGAVQFSGTGDWAFAIANAATCMPGVTFGTCTYRQGVLGLNPDGYDCVSLPSAGVIWTAQVDPVPSVGTTTVQTLVVVGLGGGINNVPFLGFEMLTLPPYIVDTGLGTHVIALPATISGYALSSQGARIEVDAQNNLYVVLMNAQDLVIG